MLDPYVYKMYGDDEEDVDYTEEPDFDEGSDEDLDSDGGSGFYSGYDDDDYQSSDDEYEGD
ncbi:hypothetical protein BKH46_03480 [Helicobacter sp. 12S02634-8]|uniref:hypothetical protein n=1 Tax=Helicobacter sp. 12S02634-8 TaxID=1476199 RepID=UPI000BA79E5A|nr:hypothetical protein [Helicobacter sp. 12S02634-8]PAF47504.1 hypothetical protein BKH46_03480 [Helicobacter sp. 12S02634-8]